MDLQHRIEILVRLGNYLLEDGSELNIAKENAAGKNSWFTPQFIDAAIKNIANAFLQQKKLEAWTEPYGVQEDYDGAKTVGIVMAGNIPLVGFHDLLCVFISGHIAVVKPSSKDEVLIKHLVQKMYEWENTIQNNISFAEKLKGCDAYIATGSNNSARYFEYYFGKYPSVIRRNRTSVAVLDGSETPEELSLLADDIQMYFGMGCRNVTKLYVPEQYDFIPLLHALRKYDYFGDFHKYKNNYDYQLSLHILNNKYFMSSNAVLLIESPALFSPVSQINYEYYSDKAVLSGELPVNNEIQCVVGKGFAEFGSAQTPQLHQYADGIDTMAFLCGLGNS